MKALFLTHNFPRYRGDPVGSFVLRLAVALREYEIDVQVVAPAAADAPLSDVLDGIPVTRFHYAPRRWETIAYTGSMAQDVGASITAKLAMAGLLGAGYRAAKRVVSQWGPDVVHAHWWFPAGLTARLLRGRLRLPYVVTSHGSDLRLASKVPGGRALFRYVSGGASAVTTVSSWLASQARALDPRCAPIVAPMPVVGDLFVPGGVHEPARLLFVGKLTEQKGLHHLLRAMSLMRAKPSLDVVGAGRVDDAAVRALAVSLGLNEQITWHPLLTQSQLAERYRSAAVHVIPAIGEGLGLTAVESLLCETPVVAFASGGLPDVVIPDRTGLLVPAGDADALARALDRLLDDAPLRARLGTDGRAFALAHFGAVAVAGRYSDVLRSAARGRSTTESATPPHS